MAGGGGEPSVQEPVFLVLTEDGGSQAVDTIAALTKVMLTTLEPDLNRDKIRFEPPEAHLRQALSGNKWKSQSPRDQPSIVDLRRSIATHLGRPNGYVIFHFDGDTAYADRARSENSSLFEQVIIAKVAELLRKPAGTPQRKMNVPTVAQHPHDPEAISRLLVLTPHYCVEAWTYYNFNVLRELCSPHEHPTLADWERAPEQLEELLQPWRHLSVGKDHNLDLARRRFPTETAMRTQKSFADTVARLRQHQALPQALRGLRYPWRVQSDDGGDGPGSP